PVVAPPSPAAWRLRCAVDTSFRLCTRRGAEPRGRCASASWCRFTVRIVPPRYPHSPDFRSGRPWPGAERGAVSSATPLPQSSVHAKGLDRKNHSGMVSCNWEPIGKVLIMMNVIWRNSVSCLRIKKVPHRYQSGNHPMVPLGSRILTDPAKVFEHNMW
ncbi:unnamed protein product, partial [Gulo gulo]